MWKGVAVSQDGVSQREAEEADKEGEAWTGARIIGK